jgi:hypothetical protein
MIQLHCMRPTPIGVEKCLFLSIGVDLLPLLWILVDFCLFLSTLDENCLLRAFSYFTSIEHGAICTAAFRRMSMKKDYQHCLDKLATAAPETKSALIRSLLPGIDAALNSGQRLKAIWEALRREGLQMSYHSFHKTVSRSRQMKKPTPASGLGKHEEAPAAQGSMETKVAAVENRDPFANLKRLEQNRPGFHWRATRHLKRSVNEREDFSDKHNR